MLLRSSGWGMGGRRALPLPGGYPSRAWWDVPGMEARCQQVSGSVRLPRPWRKLSSVKERKLFGDCGGALGNLGELLLARRQELYVGCSFPALASRYSGSELRHRGGHTEPGTWAILNPAVLAAEIKTQMVGADAWLARGGQFPRLGAQDGGRDPSLFGTVDTACGQMIEAVRVSETSREYCGCETWFLPFGDRKSFTA